MRKFKFRLESVLKIRKAKEEKRLEALAAAQNELQRQQQELSRLIDQFHQGLTKIRQVRSQDTDPFPARHAQVFLDGLEEVIEEQKLVVQKAERDVQSAMEKALEAMKERKMMDRLKEKHYEAHIKQEMAEEGKVLDEFASLSRKQAAKA